MDKTTFKIYEDKVIASIEIIGEVEIGLEDALNKLNDSNGCNILLYSGASLKVEDYIRINSRHKLQFIGERTYDVTEAEIHITCNNNIISVGTTPKRYTKELIPIEMNKFSDILQLIINKGIESIEDMQAGITVDLLKGTVKKVYKVAWINEEIKSNHILKTYDSKGYIRNYKKAIKIQEETDEIVGLLNNSRIQTYKKIT